MLFLDGATVAANVGGDGDIVSFLTFSSTFSSALRTLRSSFFYWRFKCIHFCQIKHPQFFSLFFLNAIRPSLTHSPVLFLLGMPFFPIRHALRIHLILTCEQFDVCVFSCLRARTLAHFIRFSALCWSKTTSSKEMRRKRIGEETKDAETSCEMRQFTSKAKWWNTAHINNILTFLPLHLLHLQLTRCADVRK